MRRRRHAAAPLLLLAVLSCRARERPAEAKASDPKPAPQAAVPVQTARAAVATLDRTVDASGHTVALVQQKVRAPFAGTLLSLSVIDGDRVHRGAVVGSVLSRDSEAALAGAREMEREAKTPAEQEDARRALALAERNTVQASLRAPVDGVVLAHAAAAGDRVTDDQELLTLADAGALVFVADVPQSALAQIRPGQAASIAFPGQARPASGSVHDVLPQANAADFTAPVRIDFAGGAAPAAVGLFGTVHVVVDRKANALVVPDAAVLRDDVTGKSRIALVQDGRARWRDAVVGLRGSAGTELLQPALQPGDVVIVGGQVGLPDGAAVAASP
ncbi:MAG TPA: HlyD family efflux transporter periplasmic adaptor subunit [Thermoanaerobaculia bacterium]